VAESHVTFLFPAFNEAESIGAVLTRLRGMDLLVVDDGSTDETAEVARAAGARVLALGRNHGYDGALVKGLLWCKQEQLNLVVTSDADGQHRPEDLLRFASALQEGQELVTGNRDSFARFGERLMSIYGKLRFDMRDPLCGLKGYDLSKVTLEEIQGIQGSVGSGLAFEMVRRGTSLSEYKIFVSPRLHGPSKFGSGVRANQRIFQALLREILKDLNLRKN
jgi:glycosyltransferase involved in cell wall biosynthesis